jgi:hypothetical protein
MIDTFKASAQYNDWEGTVAADDDSNKAIRELLNERSLIEESELVIGIDFWCGENHGGHVQEPYIHALVVQAKNFDQLKVQIDVSVEPLDIRRVELEGVSVNDFIGLFKRLSINFVQNGLDLVGRTYRIKE